MDAGHFQIEMDLLTYECDHDTAGGANTQTESWGIAPINLKVGLRNRTDLQGRARHLWQRPHPGSGGAVS